MLNLNFCAIFLSIFVLFLLKLEINAAPGTTTPTPKNNSESVIWFDDAVLQEMATKLDVLQLATDNLRMKLDVIKDRLSVQPHIINEKLAQLLSNLTLAKQCETSANSSKNGSNWQLTKPHPASCAEALHNTAATSGIYELYIPNSGLAPFKVSCLKDAENGAAWTLIQRRKDGSTNFFRDWQAYKDGFGFLDEEFFLGLEKIYAMTNHKKHELWVKLEDFEGEERKANYKLFAIDNESGKYALNILGTYSGNAGDSLHSGFGMKFTTKDSDNDNSNSNCAVTYTGAWWYNNCHESNLNGQYMSGAHPNRDFAKSVVWKTWREYYYSLRYVHMAIRPVS